MSIDVLDAVLYGRAGELRANEDLVRQVINADDSRFSFEVGKAALYGYVDVVRALKEMGADCSDACGWVLQNCRDASAVEIVAMTVRDALVHNLFDGLELPTSTYERQGLDICLAELDRRNLGQDVWVGWYEDMMCRWHGTNWPLSFHQELFEHFDPLPIENKLMDNHNLTSEEDEALAQGLREVFEELKLKRRLEEVLPQGAPKKPTGKVRL